MPRCVGLIGLPWVKLKVAKKFLVGT